MPWAFEVEKGRKHFIFGHTRVRIQSLHGKINSGISPVGKLNQTQWLLIRQPENYSSAIDPGVGHVTAKMYVRTCT